MEDEYLRRARRQERAQRDYFDEEEVISEDIQHSSGSGYNQSLPDEDEVDPLDAFMQGIDAQVEQQNGGSKAASSTESKPQVLSHSDDQDGVYVDLSLKAKQKTSGQDNTNGANANNDYQNNFDEDDSEMDRKKAPMETIVPLNHTDITYETFRKNFYTPHPDIANLSSAECQALQSEIQVQTEGEGDIPSPIRSFMHLNLDNDMLRLLIKQGYEAPTPIQAQAMPIALSGRDMIGLAQTGSGKTLAFTLPMVTHCIDQRELEKGEGPIAIVLAPTRELAHQTFVVTKKFITLYGGNCASVYGGVGRWDQIQALRKGAEIVVGTPGRVIEMIRKKTMSTKRVTFVVLDEADRMFDMGFEPQIRSVLGQTRPDRQTLLFSATFRRRIDLLTKDVLTNPVKVTIGQIGQANEDITQVAVVLPDHRNKWGWLMEHISRLQSDGRLLIFANSKDGCEQLSTNLTAKGFQSCCLHGGKTQPDRMEALQKFKSGECSVLVATDVAARGLDIKDIKTVVNYDVAKNIDTHTHRIGRTGRMGVEGFEPGIAYTLVTKKEAGFAAQLVQNMNVTGQEVSQELLSLAQKDSRFRRNQPPPSRSDQSNWKSQSDEHWKKSEAETRSKEMDRWSNAKTGKSKAEQRRGLGFDGPAPRIHEAMNGKQRIAFVPASGSGVINHIDPSHAAKPPPPAMTTPPATSTEIKAPPEPPVVMPQPIAAVKESPQESKPRSPVSRDRRERSRRSYSRSSSRERDRGRRHRQRSRSRSRDRRRSRSHSRDRYRRSSRSRSRHRRR